eukprot:3310893-Amphidinium_carterae.1
MPPVLAPVEVPLCLIGDDGELEWAAPSESDGSSPHALASMQVMAGDQLECNSLGFIVPERGSPEAECFEEAQRYARNFRKKGERRAQRFNNCQARLGGEE